MILAAGRGERLRPLTDVTPKPLIEVGGKALIVHHLDKLAAAGVMDVVVNLGWLGEQIPEALGDGSRWGVSIHYSQEPPGALETAGGIVHALDLLGDDPFLVVSGDVMTDIPLAGLLTRRLSGPAHLVMVDNPPHHPDGDFALDGNRLTLDGQPRLTFSGIAVFSPGWFRNLRPGRRALRPLFEQAIGGGLLTGEYFGGYWSDVGTPERLEKARRRKR